MMARLFLLLIAMVASGVAFAEGGCPQGQTPRLYGAVWGCAPGGTDAPAQAEQPAPPRPTGEWKEAWGAFAADNVTGTLGTAVDRPNRAAAEQAAVNDCHAKGGKTCRIELWYANACAVMVLGAKKYYMRSAPSVEEGSRAGMAQCNASDSNCRLYHSACSQPKFIPY